MIIKLKVVNLPGFTLASPHRPPLGLSGQGLETLRFMADHPTLIAALTEALDPHSAGEYVVLALPDPPLEEKTDP